MLEQKVVTPCADEHRIGEHDFPAVEAELNEIDRESAVLAQATRLRSDRPLHCRRAERPAGARVARD